MDNYRNVVESKMHRNQKVIFNIVLDNQQIEKDVQQLWLR